MILSTDDDDTQRNKQLPERRVSELTSMILGVNIFCFMLILNTFFNADIHIGLFLLPGCLLLSKESKQMLSDLILAIYKK